MDYTIGYLPHPEGDYNQSNPYTPMAVVHLNGESFISKVNVPAGIIPRVSTNWTNYWQSFAAGTGGAQGATGAQGIQGPAGSGGSGGEGSQGTQGYQGAQGATGVGTQGAQGSQGSTGVGSSWWYVEEELSDGKLPYKISDLKGPNTKAKEGDYILDLGGKVLVIDRIEQTDITAWSKANNIKGASGAQGPQGIQGRDGAYAAQGIQGKTGAQGTQGIQGKTGAQGTQGYIGPTGTPSTNVETWTFTMEDDTVVTKQIYIQ